MIRTVLARAATEVAVVRHHVTGWVTRTARYWGLAPTPDHEVLILHGRVEHLTHPAHCEHRWCQVSDVLSRVDGDDLRAWSGVFTVDAQPDGSLALEFTPGGDR